MCRACCRTYGSGSIQHPIRRTALSTPDRTDEIIVDGDLLRAGDADYDDARRVFNTLYDRHPAAIARCASERDVVGWTRTLNARLQRHGEPSSFPNFVADIAPGALRHAYPTATLERLQAAKIAWDPTNVFCNNHSLF